MLDFGFRTVDLGFLDSWIKDFGLRIWDNRLRRVFLDSTLGL